MKIDLSDLDFFEIEMTFKHGVKINITNLTTGKGGFTESTEHGITVRAGEGNYNALGNLPPRLEKFINPNGDWGFILTREKETE